MTVLKVDPLTQRLRGVCTFNGKIVGQPIIVVQAPFGATTAEPKIESPSPTRTGAFITTCVFHTTCTQPNSTDSSLTRPFDIGIGGVVDSTTNPPEQVHQTFLEVAQWFPSTPPGSDMATAVALEVSAESL